MSDSDWNTLTGSDAGQYESQYTSNPGHGLDAVGTVPYVQNILPIFDPPPPLFPVFPPAQANFPKTWETTRTDIFSLLFRIGISPPAPRPVQQYCDRCSGEHKDTLVDHASQSNLGTPDWVPSHVPNYEYGHREGNLYLSYSIRGTQLKRTTRVRLQGPQLFDQVQLGAARWERKSIDHVEQGPYIHWLTAMRRKDCLTKLSKLVFDDAFVEGELLAMLHQVGATDSLLDDGGDFSELITSAKELDDPRFTVAVGDEGELEVALADRSDDGELRPRGDARLRRRKGGFNTIVDWKPADD